MYSKSRQGQELEPGQEGGGQCRHVKSTWKLAGERTLGTIGQAQKVVSYQCSGKQAQVHYKIEILSDLPLLENRWEESKDRPRRTWIKRIYRRKPCIEESYLWVEQDRDGGGEEDGKRCESRRGAVESSSAGLFL